VAPVLHVVPLAAPPSAPVSPVELSMPEELPLSMPELLPLSVPELLPLSAPELLPELLLLSAPELLPLSVPELLPLSLPELLPLLSAPDELPEPSIVPSSLASLPPCGIWLRSKLTSSSHPEMPESATAAAAVAITRPHFTFGLFRVFMAVLRAP
jgi:hypothetical protein